jgi:hypothetical protein
MEGDRPKCLLQKPEESRIFHLPEYYITRQLTHKNIPNYGHPEDVGMHNSFIL